SDRDMRTSQGSKAPPANKIACEYRGEHGQCTPWTWVISPEQTVLCFHEHGGMPRMQQAGIMSRLAATVLALAALMVNASAQDTLKVATAQRGAWESAVPELGQQAGIFKKHGISLDLVHTRDAAE